MKSHLTRAQSDELFALGVPTSKATLYSEDGVFLFTLADLFDIIPKSIQMKYRYLLKITLGDEGVSLVR